MSKVNKSDKDKSLERKKLIQKEFNAFLDKNFKWFVIMVVIVVFIFGFLSLIKPKYDNTKKIIESMNKQENLEIQSKKRELTQIKKILTDYGTITEKEKDKLFKIIPEKYDHEELFSEINHLVTRNGLVMNQLSISLDKSSNSENVKGTTAKKDFSDEDIGVININLSVEGITSYNMFKTFLNTLENYLKLLDVETANYGTGFATFTIKTYYIK